MTITGEKREYSTMASRIKLYHNRQHHPKLYQDVLSVMLHMEKEKGKHLNVAS